METIIANKYSIGRISGIVSILESVRDHFEAQQEFGLENPSLSVCCNIVTRSDGKVCKCAVGALMSERALKAEKTSSNAHDLSEETIGEIHDNVVWSCGGGVVLEWAFHPPSLVNKFRQFLAAVQFVHDGFASRMDGEKCNEDGTGEYAALRMQQFLFAIREVEHTLRDMIEHRYGPERAKGYRPVLLSVMNENMKHRTDTLLDTALVYSEAI